MPKLFDSLYFDLAKGITMAQAAHAMGQPVVICQSVPVVAQRTADDNDPICGTCGEAPTDCLCEETIKEEFYARGFTWDEEQCMFSGRLYDVVPTLPLRWISSCVVYRIDSQTDKVWQNTNYDSITLLLEAWGKR
jgi:hypothetical protein